MDISTDAYLTINPDLPEPIFTAERALLGQLMLNSTVFETAISRLGPEHFSDASNRTLFLAIRDAREHCSVLDPQTFFSFIINSDGWTVDELEELMQTAPHEANAEYYIAVLEQAYNSLQIARQSRELALISGRLAVDSAVASEIQRRVDQISRRLRPKRPKSSTLAESIGEIEEQLFDASPPQVMATQSIFGDHLHIQHGSLVLIAAVAGHGKSTLLSQLAWSQVIADADARLLVFNVEMSTQQIIERLLAHITNVPLSIIQGRQFRNRDSQSRARADAIRSGLDQIRRVSERVVLQCQESDLTALQTACQGFEPTVVVLDYIQKIRPTDARVEEREQIETVMHAATEIRSKYKATILAASAINRESVSRMKKGTTPTLDMQCLRGSTELEHAPDLVLTLWTDHNDERGNRDKVWNSTALIAKDRHGGQSGRQISLEFNGHTQTFQPQRSASVRDSVENASKRSRRIPRDQRSEAW